MYYYLASPYSAPDPTTLHNRYLAAMSCTAHLLARRMWVYSPIVHCHEMAQTMGLPTDFAFWQDYNRAMLDQAFGLLVLQIPGAAESLGVAEEIAYAKKLDIPITEILPKKGSYELRLANNGGATRLINPKWSHDHD